MQYSSTEVCNKNDQTTYLTVEDFEGFVAIASGEDSR